MSDNLEKSGSAKKQNSLAKTGKRMSRWMREMRSELKKVVWPTRAQVTNNSVIVVVCVTVVGVLIALFDFIMNIGVRALLDLTH